MRQRAMRQMIPKMKCVKCVKCQTYKKGDIHYTAIFSVSRRKLHKRSLKKSEKRTSSTLQVHCAVAVAALRPLEWLIGRL